MCNGTMGWTSINSTSIKILSSECGVLRDIDESKIISKNRLEPGKILLVDFNKEKLVSDSEIKQHLSNKSPYKQWIDENLVYLTDLVKQYNKEELDVTSTNGNGNGNNSISHPFAERVSSMRLDLELTNKLNCFGFTTENVPCITICINKYCKESFDSMGNEESLAILSNQPK